MEGPDTAFTIVSSWKSKLAEKQHVSVRSKQYRYIRYSNGSEELYNHKKDDFEWHNLAEDKKVFKNQRSASETIRFMVEN